MKAIRVDVRRSDLIRLNLQLLPRLRSTWVTWVVIALLIFLLVTYGQGLPTTSRQWVVLAMSMTLGATVGLLAGFVFSLLFILLSSQRSNGVLGEHYYTLRDDGLHERTHVNDSLTKWEGIESVRKTSSYILVQVTPWLYHVLPRHSFETLEAYEEFWSALLNRVRQDRAGQVTPSSSGAGG